MAKGKKKAPVRGFAKPVNRKIAEDLLSARRSIRNGSFDLNALADEHGVTYQVVLGVLQRLRRQKKIPTEDRFVVPIGEKWKNAKSMRESERKEFIVEHMAWSIVMETVRAFLRDSGYGFILGDEGGGP